MIRKTNYLCLFLGNNDYAAHMAATDLSLSMVLSMRHFLPNDGPLVSREGLEIKEEGARRFALGPNKSGRSRVPVLEAELRRFNFQQSANIL